MIRYLLRPAGEMRQSITPKVCLSVRKREVLFGPIVAMELFLVFTTRQTGTTVRSWYASGLQ